MEYKSHLRIKLATEFTGCIRTEHSFVKFSMASSWRNLSVKASKHNTSVARSKVWKAAKASS
jgi:hypothetical protein